MKSLIILIPIAIVFLFVNQGFSKTTETSKIVWKRVNPRNSTLMTLGKEAVAKYEKEKNEQLKFINNIEARQSSENGNHHLLKIKTYFKKCKPNVSCQKMLYANVSGDPNNKSQLQIDVSSENIVDKIIRGN
ncbi:Hypothetical protein SRAE_1000043800 [Strongyloides ratti]|uniref:Proteinase inhibitor I25, cystatin domain-containing protein n=1 Tax=Strongyloides ratti TaxID=34506 RepID=A0A090L3X2_STRRB|nr:Hypothetical protein SRAE_1000043800 [Strongyloides ratti]CEF62164.1 Hypothetical protein SRAE_1000043800 [Strongyloides ratti]